MKSFELAGLTLARLDDEGPLLDSEQGALDMLGEAYGTECYMLVIPVTRLPDAFFRLASGIAGAALQKFTNYGQRVAFVGDISPFTARSGPLRDFVRETNARKQIIFASDEAELERLLSR